VEFFLIRNRGGVESLLTEPYVCSLGSLLTNPICVTVCFLRSRDKVESLVEVPFLSGVLFEWRRNRVGSLLQGGEDS